MGEIVTTYVFSVRHARSGSLPIPYPHMEYVTVIVYRNIDCLLSVMQHQLAFPKIELLSLSPKIIIHNVGHSLETRCKLGSAPLMVTPGDYHHGR